MFKRLLAMLFLGISFLLIASAVRAVTVTRSVYVAAVDADSVTIAWHTQEAVASIVDYGPTLAYGSSARSKQPSQVHVVTLHRLEAGRVYYYRVRAENETLFEGPDYFFRTLPTKTADRFRFLAWGDSGKGSSDQYALAAIMEQADADFLIHTGDLVYNGGEAENFNPKYFNPYKGFLCNTPVYPSLGNHDVVTDDGQPYLDAFFLPHNNPDDSERYYSFNYGQAHFVCLDTNGLFTTTELEWLEQDLASATTTWKFVYMHLPPYSCGEHGSSGYVRRRVASLFEQYGVDLVFTGHDHDYQRSYPMLAEGVVDSAQDPDYVDPQGVIYLVTGGGAGERDTSSACTFTKVAISIVHFVQVDVDGARLTLRAIEQNGQVIDSFTLEKTPQVLAQRDGDLAGDRAPRARLLSNQPNPFNPITLLRYEMLSAETMRLAVFDPLGRMVRRLDHGHRNPGRYRALWDGRDAQGRRVGSGVYFVRLEVGPETLTRKLLLTK